MTNECIHNLCEKNNCEGCAWLIDVSNLGSVMVYWPDVGWIKHPDFIKEGEK